MTKTEKERKKERKEQKPKVNLRDASLMVHLSGNIQLTQNK